MKNVDVLMPTLGKKGDKTVKSLAANFTGFNFDVFHSSVYGWSRAINEMLTKFHHPERDVLIIDDDVEVLPDTFKGFDDYYELADVFGFKLLYPDGTLQHGGGFVNAAAQTGHLTTNVDQPSYVQYVTASLCYIKADVIKEIKALQVWPGVQYEDVALCMEAWLAGFKVMYLPMAAIHEETGTKRFEADLQTKLSINAYEFKRKYREAATQLSFLFGNDRRLPIGYPHLQPLQQRQNPSAQ